MKKIMNFLLFGAPLGILLLFSSPVFADLTMVQIDTSEGNIIVELYDDDAPVTVANFLSYVDDDYYEDLIFHRVLAGFMIQGGIYDSNLYDVDFSGTVDLQDPNFWHEPGDPIDLETDADLDNDRGTIAMARTSDPDSATSQFFINVVDNDHLNPSSSVDGYAVFGRVTNGMDVADDIVGKNIIETAPTTDYFEGLPVSTVTINDITRVRSFSAGSDDFSAVDFINAADGTVRTYGGQNGFSAEYFRENFSAVEFLGVDCLKWERSADTATGADSFTIWITKDDSGAMWILKYIVNEDADNEDVLIEAGSLYEAVSFTDYGDRQMVFRLAAAGYNPADLNDPSNSISNGVGSTMETETITSVTASLSPDYTDADLVVVKWFRGAVGSESDIDYRYYHEDAGLVLDLDDDAHDVAGDGWRLAQASFDSASNDFSAVSFLQLPADTALTRTYAGQGDMEDDNYTAAFTYPTDEFQGAAYLQWVQDGIDVEGIDSFTLKLAKDIDGELWIIEYILNDVTIVDASNLTEIELFSDYASDSVHFTLINQLHNSSDVSDPDNTVVRTVGGVTITETITGFTDTLSYVPHYEGELIKVKKWEGAVENDNDVAYYHQSVGLVQIHRDGAVGNSDDGWFLAFYGGIFDSDSDDFTDIDYLNASVDSDSRFMVGQGAYIDTEIQYIYNQRYITSSSDRIECLSWSYIDPNEDGGIVDEFLIYLSRDSLGEYWVFKYRLNNADVFNVATYANDRFRARLLSEFSDENPYFRLVAGEYDADDLNNSINTVVRGVGDEQVTEQFTSFNASLSHIPYYNDDLVVVKTTYADPNIDVRWSYYHPDDGLAVDIWQDDDSPDDTDLDGWRLGWAGKTEPTFDSASDDFSQVSYITAGSGSARLYQGQGSYDGSSYRRSFGAGYMLEVNCLEISETAVDDWDKASSSMLVAHDKYDESFWIFKHIQDGVTLFEASVIDQIIPFERYSDALLQLVAADSVADVSFTYGAGAAQIAGDVISTTESIPQNDDYDNSLALVRVTVGENSDDIDWGYYHDSVGLALELWDDFYDPNLTDPNLDDPSIIETDGDGWLLTDPQELSNVKASFRAGRSRTTAGDSFTASGDIDADDDNLVGGDLIIQVGPLLVTIDTNSSSFRQIGGSSRYMYNGSTDGTNYISLLLDLRRDTFRITARRVNLTGLIEPVLVNISFGDFIADATASVTGGVPTAFVQNVRDVLMSNRYILKSDTFNGSTSHASSATNRKITIFGEIGAQDGPVDLSDEDVDVTVTWSNQSYQADEGAFRKIGRLNRYVLVDPDGQMTFASIDWDRGVFKIIINRAGVGAPSAVLRIQIDDNNVSVFDQTATVD